MLLAALALAWRGLGVKLSELGRHLQVPVPDPSWDLLSVAVEASRCAALLRSIREGPVIDLGPASMISAWLLRQGKVVLSLGGSMAGLVQVEASLEEVLEALERLRRPPALIFVQAATLLAGGLPALASQVPVMGAMLTDQGQEVPHWVLPSLVSPMLNTSRLRVELPCWSNSCEGEGRQSTKLLALVMIVKNEARRIRETLMSVLEAADLAVILDTGSTDGTQRILREAASAHGLRLELHSGPFEDFAAARNRALRLAGAQAEFLLMLSGDETLVHPKELRTFARQHADFCGGSEEPTGRGS
ncbi:unnamed protein product [Effrenium voratum]|nr:unnamed protein product [Effrenium voratum]